MGFGGHVYSPAYDLDLLYRSPMGAIFSDGLRYRSRYLPAFHDAEILV
jgi:hypothetical protein